jgi:hypothetical protein
MPFGIPYDPLVGILSGRLVHFSQYWYAEPRKIWQPCPDAQITNLRFDRNAFPTDCCPRFVDNISSENHIKII